MENNQLQKEENQNLQRFLPTLQPNSFTDIVQVKGFKSVAVLRKEDNLKMVKAELSVLIYSIAVHYDKSFSAEQINSVIEIMLKEGYMVNGLDFKLFATKAKNGEYKNRVDIIEGREFAIKFFNLTPDTLIDWFKIYIFDRGEEFAKQNQIKPKQAITDNEIKLVQIFADAVPKVQEKPKEAAITEQQKVKEKVQTIWNEFKALQMEQDSRLVEVNGKHYDYNEFLKLRTNGNYPD